MDCFEHNEKNIFVHIEYDRTKPRGKNKSLIIFLEDFLTKDNSLVIPFVGFDKDLKDETGILNVINKHLNKIEDWMNLPKNPVKRISLDFDSPTFVEDYCKLIAENN